MSNTWGALSWGQGSWAAQGDVGLTASGISASFSIGNIVADAELQVGWGGDTWGENEWGDLSGSQPVAVGSQLTSSIGTVQENIIVDVSVSVTNVGQMAFGEPSALGGTSIVQSVTGQQIAITGGEEVVGIGVELTSTNLQATTSIGSATVDDSTLTGIGWGRRTWGNLAWGGAYSAIAVGQELTSTINFPATGAFTDVSISVSGLQLNATYANPSFSIQIDQDIFVLASEDQLDINTATPTVEGLATVDVSGSQLTGSIGNTIAGLKTPVDVTGIQATMSLGTFTLVQSTNEPATGQQMAASLGTPSEIPGQIIGVSGLQMASSIGSVTVTGVANIDVTGIQLTASIGNVNITSWQEINPGVTNTWSEVDLAA